MGIFAGFVSVDAFVPCRTPSLSSSSSFIFIPRREEEERFLQEWQQPQQRRREQLIPQVGRRIQKTHLQLVIPPHVWSSIIPPFLGFYKSEWTVSLGYGIAIAWTAAILGGWNPTTGILPTVVASSSSGLTRLHAAPLCFYGIRLSIFLIIRNIISTRIQEMNQRIEDRAQMKGNRWTTRLPFILSCGLLYYGLSIPLWFTKKLSTTITTPLTGWKYSLMMSLIAIQWLGFGMAALGDFTKTYVKIQEKDEKFLVTSGIFSWIRHPNYTGEIIGWTGNAVTGLVAWGLNMLFFQKDGLFSPTALTNVGLLSLGWVGILFVLLRATSTLETRQGKDYGDLSKYQSWIATSWGGWKLSPQTTTTTVNGAQVTTPQLELDPTSVEESGSGI